MVHCLLSLFVTALLATMPAESIAQAAARPRQSRAAKAVGAQSQVVPQQTLDRLVKREKELAGAEKRHATATIDEALADDFHELAADGRLYSKTDIMPMLKDVTIEDFTLSDFQVLPIDPECVLLTYINTIKGNYKGQSLPPKVAVSSFWVRRSGSWRIVFHQATPVPETAN